MNSPFSTTLPPARATFAAEPARNALVSLSLLTAPDADDAWVARVAGQLALIQRLNNRVVFERFGAALTAVKDAADFPAWLAALGRTHPALLRDLAREAPAGLDSEIVRAAAPLVQDAIALRAFLVEHLGEMWSTALQPEWARAVAPLRALSAALAQHHANLIGTAPEVARAVLRRNLPDAALAALDGARTLVFVLSPHAPLRIIRFGEPETAHVFTRFDPTMLRQAPVKRVESLSPLAALADDTRLRLLELLAAADEMRGQDLVSELEISQPNVSRHLKQLVGAGLVEERRAGDANKLYRLKPGGLDAALFKLGLLIAPSNARANRDQARADAARASALSAHPPELRPFLDEAGRVIHFSTKRAEQTRVLDYLIDKVAPGREYTERELTDLIAGWIAPGQGRFDIDAVTLRRALIEENALRRTPNGSKYWRDGG